MKGTFVIAVLALSLTAVTGCVEEEAMKVEEPQEQEVEIIDQELIVTDDFRLGMQLSDNGTSLLGPREYTSSMEGAAGESEWVCDGNCFDPDGARLDLDVLGTDNVKGKDFRICLRASDVGTSHQGAGQWGCTPWASLGGGTTGKVTDANGIDPDSYKVRIETRSLNTTDKHLDFRVRIRAHDQGISGVWSSYSPWSSVGGGYTGWALDNNSFDPDGFEIELQAQSKSVWGFCTPSSQCQNGFGDCDSGSDCLSGYCAQNVGNQYGFQDNQVDVCTDFPFIIFP